MEKSWCIFNLSSKTFPSKSMQKSRSFAFFRFDFVCFIKKQRRHQWFKYRENQPFDPEARRVWNAALVIDFIMCLQTAPWTQATQASVSSRVDRFTGLIM